MIPRLRGVLAAAEAQARHASAARRLASPSSSPAAAAADAGASAAGPAAGARAGRLNHVAIAVPDLAAAAARWAAVLGARVSPPRALPEHGVTVAFVALDNVTLELLEPLGAAGAPIARFLERSPAGGVHHLCVEVPDVRAGLAAAAAAGARALDAEPKIGAHGVPVAFLHPKDMTGVLTELEEVPPAPPSNAAPER